MELIKVLQNFLISLIQKLVWLNRPGVPSTLTPKTGIVQEWITSSAKIRICEFLGKQIWLKLLRAH